MKVQLENREIEIKKLPLGRYAELLKVLRTLPQKFESLSGIEDKEWLGKLPDLIIENLPDVIEIIHIGTELSMEEAHALGLREAIDLITAIVEVNEYKQVYEKIKKGMARLPQKEVPKEVSTILSPEQ